ncbi:MAG: enoyl-CoA hydratase-related protein [Hyphomicrobium sp.]|nr:enoyl-CoA hydratase-related protein [Hyphomicrobium sp.]
MTFAFDAETLASVSLQESRRHFTRKRPDALPQGTARRVKAHEAEKLGLINKLTAEAALESEVEKLAMTIAENAPLSLKAGKLAINYAAGYEFARDMKAVKDAADRCFDSADYREGRSAFLGKRKAQFKGE